jgi:hypothetical protein
MRRTEGDMPRPQPRRRSRTGDLLLIAYPVLAGAAFVLMWAILTAPLWLHRHDGAGEPRPTLRPSIAAPQERSSAPS